MEKGGEPASYHHGDLPEALVRTARALVEEGGYRGLSLRRVAARVGVSHMAPYRHFEDKRELLAAVAAEGYEELRRAMRGRAAGAEEPRAVLREVGVGYVCFAVEHAGLFRLMFSSVLADDSDLPELAAAGREAFGVLADALRSLEPGGEGIVESGEPDGNEDPPVLDDRALRAWSIVHGLAFLLLNRLVEGEVSPERAETLAYRVLEARLVSDEPG